MFRTVFANWSLFLGIGLFALGHGLQSTVLGVRASIEDFPTTLTGLIMSAYSVGFFLGSILAPKMIANVGHVRVFAAMASVASIAVLLHALLPNPIVWIFVRVVTGVAIACLYIVIESWLNASSANAERGAILSIYIVVFSGAIAASQLLLTVADPSGFEAFVLVSILISLALVPLLLAASPAPPFTIGTRFGVKQLYETSPLGCIAMFGTGVAHGAFYQMSAVYAAESGLTLAQTSIFMTAVMAGAFAFQWPVGRLSDRMDRRTVLTCSAAAAAVAAAIASMIDADSLYLLTFVFFVFAGCTQPLYALSIAHTNDFVENEDMVAASGALVMVCGVGMIIGPTLVALAMSLRGVVGFPAFLAVVHGSIALFAVYRMTRRAPTPLEEQTPHLIVTGRGSIVGNVIAQEEVLERIEEQSSDEPGADERKAENEAADAATR